MSDPIFPFPVVIVRDSRIPDARKDGFIAQEACVGFPPEDFRVNRHGVYHPPRIHQTAQIFKLATVDAGIERSTEIGARTKMFAHSHAGHDVIVGEDVQIATGAVLGGHSEIGDRARIGLNATVLPYKKVGHDAQVGAGAVVTRDVAPFEIVAGVPARHHGWKPGRPLNDSELEGWEYLYLPRCESCRGVLDPDEAELCDRCALDAALSAAEDAAISPHLHRVVERQDGSFGSCCESTKPLFRGAPQVESR